jgi:hypothetical protein
VHFIRRFWWLAVVLVIAILAYRYFNPPEPTFTKKAGVECADRLAVALVDPVPVNGAWACLSDREKAIWGDIGVAQDQGLAGWAKQRFAANSIRYVGKSHHIGPGISPEELQTDPNDLPPDEYYDIHGIWYVYAARKDAGFCIGFNCPGPETAIVFVQLDKANITGNQWDIGYCMSGLVGSMDCPAALSKVTT